VIAELKTGNNLEKWATEQRKVIAKLKTSITSM